MKSMRSPLACTVMPCVPDVQAATPEDELVKAGCPQIHAALPEPFGNYVNGHVSGKLLLVSLAAPQDVNGEFGPENAWLKGRCGDDLSAYARGVKAGELACLRSLRFAKAVVRDLSRIHRALRVTVVGVASLPCGVAMEVTVE